MLVFRLPGGRVALDARETRRMDLAVSDGLLQFSAGEGPAIRLDGCLVLPGLINAHDHLEFSLFPRLGRGPFPNARLWASAIYRPEESPVRELLEIPKPERLIWGGWKNLLAGVTTVSQHNPYQDEVFSEDFPVDVIKKYGWAHSLDFSDDVATRYQDTPADAPFLIHVAEGTDPESRRQIFMLDEKGALGPNTVLIHGVGMDNAGLDLAEQRGASIVWCPSSNLFTLGATLRPEVFERKIPIALATDSALTGVGDLLDELRTARDLGRLSIERLYEMVSTEPARILRLPRPAGRLTDGGPADLMVVRDTGVTPAETILSSEPLLVIRRGKIRMVAEEFADRIPSQVVEPLHRIHLEGRSPCLVDGDIPKLLASARRSLGDDVRLAGKRILA